MRAVIFSFVAMLVAASAFVPATSYRYVSQRLSSSSLRMGLFDGIFGGGTAAADNRVVEASHILLSGPNASEECEKMKVDIYNDALGWFGKAENGVEPEKLVKAFASKARARSTCPSSGEGGSLGAFGRGQMVKEFDEVAFNAQIGVVHGPVETQFGSHLILITNRE